MNTRLFPLLIGALAAALLATGCGSSDDGTTDSVAAAASSPSKGEFIAKADSICSTQSAALPAEAKAYEEKNGFPTAGEPTAAQKEALIVEVFVPNVERQADEIAALGAPSGDEATVGAIVDGIREAAAKTAKDPGGVIEEGDIPFDEVNDKASAYGLSVCGVG